jgi:hypothetical protein
VNVRLGVWSALATGIVEACRDRKSRIRSVEIVAVENSLPSVCSDVDRLQGLDRLALTWLPVRVPVKEALSASD